MNTHFSPTVATLRELQRMRPNYSEIARELGVTPQHVRRVFLGLSVSARVMRAIERRIKADARKRLKEAA